MNFPEVIKPEFSGPAYAGFESPRQLITRAVWNSVAAFASVAQALRLSAPPQGVVQRLVCQSDLPVRARRSFAGVAIPKKHGK